MRKLVLILPAFCFAAWPAWSQATVAMRAGVTTTYTDSTGQVWAADSGSTCTGTGTQNVGTYNVTNAILGALPSASDQPLYQNERYGACTWTFPVPNGNYNVTLKFAELYFSTAGARIFGVSINGASVLSGFDIFAAAGGQFKAIDKSFPVSVAGASITVQFVLGSANVPKVDAIEIAPAPGPSATPPAPPGAGTATNATQPGTLAVAGTNNGAAVSQQFNTNSPVTFTFTAAQHSATLTWTASTTPSVTGYNVFRSQTSGTFGAAPLNASLVTGTTYTDTTVAAGQTYYYVVQSVAPACPAAVTITTPPCGSSINSNQVTAVIPSP